MYFVNLFSLLNESVAVLSELFLSGFDVFTDVER